MKNFVLINSENRFPRTREITSDRKEIPFSFTKREGKEFTDKLDETEIFEHEFDDPDQKKEFYSLLFKTELEILSI
jgi:hypothetical protein